LARLSRLIRRFQTKGSIVRFIRRETLQQKKEKEVSLLYLSVHELLVRTGLPDGLFQDQKSQFGYILKGLGMEHFGIFYGRVV
jgi:hypothetical protein